MRLIDADELQKHCAEQAAMEWNKQASPYSWSHALEAFSDDVENAPTVDAVPVVRCRECKYREPTRGRFKNELPYFCTIHRGKFCDLEEFCSFGEQEVQDAAD